MPYNDRKSQIFYRNKRYRKGINPNGSDRLLSLYFQNYSLTRNILFAFTETELEQKIADIFDLFDHERNKTIDFRELGTVIRALGKVPTEAEVVTLVREVRSPNSSHLTHTTLVGK